MATTAAKLILFLNLSLILFQLVHSHWAIVDFHTENNCNGPTRGQRVETYCFKYTYNPAAARLRRGSCVKLFKDSLDRSCQGEHYMLAYPQKEVCTLPFGVAQTVYECQILSWNSHGRSISNPSKSGCNVAAHGVSSISDEEWAIFTEPQVECSRSTSGSTVNLPVEEFETGDAKQTFRKFVTGNGTNSLHNGRVQALCNVNTVLTGIWTIIDEAGVIKEFGWYCSPVVDPTAMCEPLESLGTVVQCDNTASGNELQCSYSQTVGVGESHTMSASEQKEMQFSQEMGFEIGGGIFGLSAKMSTKLGFSQLVGYEWSQSDTSTWTTETTVSATIIVRPYAHSRLEQLVGKCSFYGTNVNFFKQTDINSTGVAEVRYFSV